MAFVQYGNYQHDPGEVELQVQQTVQETEAGTPYSVLTRFSLSGMLVGSGLADMNAKVAALAAAYSQNGYDLGLMDDFGAPTHLVLLSANCLGGSRVTVRPSFPDLRRAAMVTFVPYQIELEGEVLVADRPTDLLEFTESISRSGGGPRFGFLEPLNGAPIKQQLKKKTVYRATQRGRGLGLLARPTVPRPIWPAALMESPTIETGSPRRRGFGADLVYTRFPVSWSYEFQSAVPLIGDPNAWGV